MDQMTQSKIEAWTKDPFDEKTRNVIEKLLKESPESLEDAFYTDLTFGTAGLRGIMGIGTNRMNLYTIRKTTEGLALYLKEQFPKKASVVIGFDSRNHSEEFASEAAEVLSYHGIEVFLLKNLRPTPFVSFACRHYKASAAIMITASHNPKEYNGYKVYWQDGAQVVAPHDQGIMDKIEQIKSFKKPFPARKDLIHIIDDMLDIEYLKAISPLQSFPEENKKYGKDLLIAYTSLHGTGITLAPKALEDWGFSSIDTVASQVIPDGSFPTVKLPNPEYPEALKLGIDLMKEKSSDLLLATDPDADRLGIVVSHKGEPVILRGNEIASLCTAYLCDILQKKKHPPKNPAFITTVVSSQLIETICSFHHIPCYKVLTGFKYIGEKIHEWEINQKHTFIFGAEESYGYLLGTHARDKDAIVSSCLIAEIALHLKKQGKTLVDFLHEIYKSYGIFWDSQLSLEFPPSKEGMESMQKFTKDLRTSPPTYIAEQKVLSFEDFLPGIHGLPSTDMLIFTLENGCRLIIRPSGTEPKVKVYGGIHFPYKQNVVEEIEQASFELKSFLEQCKTFFLQP